ncbi:cofactor-independent phosphoglycerate mutase [Candidatus Saganbacteria bacterium]|nr:cofactor-independent phosphoglycerate mutase [Candidatus Saganbacteria bacterium]
MKKYIVLIGDGMSDLPLKELGNKTPLEAANTPNLDFLVQNGRAGFVSNTPKKLPPGSDVAAMSIFGSDPMKYYTGRGPLEAASLGVKLKSDDIAFRCNLVTIADGKMASFTADHITTKEASELIKALNKSLERRGIKFYPGLSYRHLLVMTNDKCQMSNLKCIPPHDISGKEIKSFLPQGKGSEVIRDLMSESIVPLLKHPVNLKRIKEGKKPASMIWLWGQGEEPKLETFKKQFGKTAAVITAVHLLKGLGKILGMEVPDVKGATGFLDTNYKGKEDAALRMLKKHDVVFIHVEAPDECGHMGDIKGKIKAIEDFDSKIVGALLAWTLEHSDIETKLLVLPDHPTPIKYMTHTHDMVPFVVYGNKIQDTGYKMQIKRFTEKEIKKSKIIISHGYKLIKELLKKSG